MNVGVLGRGVEDSNSHELAEKPDFVIVDMS